MPSKFHVQEDPAGHGYGLWRDGVRYCRTGGLGALTLAEPAEQRDFLETVAMLLNAEEDPVTLALERLNTRPRGLSRAEILRRRQCSIRCQERLKLAREAKEASCGKR